MDIGSIFLILALLILVGLFVSRPLVERRKTVTNGPLDQMDIDQSVMLAERDRVLISLQELDFDYAMGKIPEQDYPEHRNQLLHRGAEILRRLDEIQIGDSAAGGLEERLEQAIAERRADASIDSAGGAGLGRGTPVTGSPDDEIEILLANRRRDRQEKAAGFCHQCGGPMQKSDRFCPKCGAKIT